MDNYNPSDAIAIVAGIPLDSGRGDDTFAKGEWMAPRFTTKVTVDGDVVRTKVNDRRMKWTFTVMQTSQANALLSTLVLLDSNASNGAGVGPFLFKDRNGLTLYEGAQCWVSEMPNPEWAKEAGTRDWVVEVAKCVGFEGGN